MIKYFMKKWLVKQVNGFLEEYKGNVDKAKSTLALWIGRLKNILNCLEKALASIDDNKIEDDEVTVLSDEIKRIINQW